MGLGLGEAGWGFVVGEEGGGGGGDGDGRVDLRACVELALAVAGPDRNAL